MQNMLMLTPKNCVFADNDYCVFELDSGYHLYDRDLDARQFVVYNRIHQYEVAFMFLQADNTYFVDVLTMEAPEYIVSDIEEAVRVSAREFDDYLSGGD